MTTWALIGCTKAKADHPCRAVEMYWPSALFKAALLTAESSGQERLILSAKHGVLRPGDVIEPYNVTLNTMKKPERDRWALTVIKVLDEWFRPGDVVVSYLGAKYGERVVPYLRRRGLEVQEPWKGLGQGQRLKWFADRRDHG